MSNFTAADWTYAEYARLPDDGQHYEVIDGEVCVTPAAGPRHQEVVGRLYRPLIEYVEQHTLGTVLFDIDLLFVSGQYLRPDLVYVPADRLGGITDRGVESAPGLVIEVLSPHSGHIDRIRKPPRYRDFGVPEYWVADPAARSLEVYALARGIVTPDVHADTVSFQPSAGTPPLILKIADLFA